MIMSRRQVATIANPFCRLLKVTIFSDTDFTKFSLCKYYWFNTTAADTTEATDKRGRSLKSYIWISTLT